MFEQFWDFSKKSTSNLPGTGYLPPASTAQHAFFCENAERKRQPSALRPLSPAIASTHYADNEVVLLRSTSCWATKPLRVEYILA